MMAASVAMLEKCTVLSGNLDSAKIKPHDPRLYGEDFLTRLTAEIE